MLEGTAGTIERQRPLIMLESSSSEAASFLTARAYRLYAFDSARDSLVPRDEVDKPLNIVALPDSAHRSWT